MSKHDFQPRDPSTEINVAWSNGAHCVRIKKGKDVTNIWCNSLDHANAVRKELLKGPPRKA